MVLLHIFTVLLQALLPASGSYVGDFVCPVPGDPSLTTMEDCSQFSACHWVDSACVVVSGSRQGYVYQQDPVETGTGIKATITKADESVTMYGADINTLQYQAIYHDPVHLQIKITDPSEERYEVPIERPNTSSSPGEPLYKIPVAKAGDTFLMKVARPYVHGKEATYVLEQVGPFTYEDQFIEFTIKLNTKYLYGLGENPHVQMTHKFEPRATYPMFSRDQPIGEGETGHYGVYPYYVNIEDAEGSTHSVLLQNSNAMEYSTFLLSDGSPAITIRTIGGVLDLHVFVGPTPELVNQQYSQFVGTPTLPPYWALGFHLSRWGYNSTENVRKLRTRMRDAAIPQDVQVFDIDYMDKKRDFTYDPTAFGDLPELIEELKQEDIRTVLILDPAIPIDTEDYAVFTSGIESDAFIKWADASQVPADQPAGTRDYVVGNVWPDNQTVFPDFMRPKTKQWWTDEILGLHKKLPFDGLWIDMNEPANFDTNIGGERHLSCPEDNKLESPPYPTKTAWLDNNPSKRISDKTICMSSVQKDDKKSYSHYDVHSLFGFFQSIATNEALRELAPSKRPFVLSRSSYPGSGRYVTHWLGDNTASWDQLAMSIVGMLEMNMFGVPMVGADICGFFSTPSEELCARWMQLGAFYPFSRNHNSIGLPDQDPAVWPVVAEISADILSFRYRYLPYLYTLLHEAHRDGSSVVRPLFNVFPTDLGSREVSHQFMWGSGLMVAPVVTQGATAVRMYVPPAVWYDAETGARSFINKSSESVTVSAPLDTIPLYFRGGTILPLQQPALSTQQSRTNPFGMLVALDENLEASGSVYWDDGESDLPESEAYYAVMQMVKVHKLEDIYQLQVDPVHKKQVDGLSWESIRFLGVPKQPSKIGVIGADIKSFDHDDQNQVLDIYLKFPLEKQLTLTMAFGQ